jgi:hypothetical protein
LFCKWKKIHFRGDEKYWNDFLKNWIDRYFGTFPNWLDSNFSDIPKEEENYELKFELDPFDMKKYCMRGLRKYHERMEKIERERKYCALLNPKGLAMQVLGSGIVKTMILEYISKEPIKKTS